MNGDRNNSKRPTAVSESGNHLIVSASISDTACSMFDCRSAGSETPVSYYLTCQPNFVAIEGQLSRWLSDYILRTPVTYCVFGSFGGRHQRSSNCLKSHSVQGATLCRKMAKRIRNLDCVKLCAVETRSSSAKAVFSPIVRTI